MPKGKRGCASIFPLNRKPSVADRGTEGIFFLILKHIFVIDSRVLIVKQENTLYKW